MAPEYLHRHYLLLNKLCISLLNYTNDMNGCIIDEEKKMTTIQSFAVKREQGRRKEVLIC